MSVEDSADGTEEQINDQLIPIRLKRPGVPAVVGDAENSRITDPDHVTHGVLYVTPESLLDVPEWFLDNAVQYALRDYTGDLLFDGYVDEAISTFGRNAHEIVLDEGEEAFQELDEELQGVFYNSPFLKAWLQDTPIAEVMDLSDRSFLLPFHIDHGDNDYYEDMRIGYGEPVVTVTIEVDGETYTRDLREDVPTEKELREFHLYGELSDSQSQSQMIESINRFTAPVEDPDRSKAPPSYDKGTNPVLLYRDGSNYTLHRVDQHNTSAVEDEQNSVRTLCGCVLPYGEENVYLDDVDLNQSDISIGSSRCGNCFP